MAESGAFTTWRDLVNQLKSDLAGRAFRTMQSYSLTAGGGGSRTVSYRSLKELKDLLTWAEEEADKDEGAMYAGRTYAANRGRG